MIQCASVYIKDVQRNKGVMTVSTVPPILYRQDHSAHTAASNIQRAWREFRLWNFSYTPIYPTNLVNGAFSHLYGYYPNHCATKIQTMFRGYKARQEVPMKRMALWIINNILE